MGGSAGLDLLFRARCSGLSVLNTRREPFICPNSAEKLSVFFTYEH